MTQDETTPTPIPEQDFSLLRPFDLRLVSQGDELCDTRGRHVGIEAATEMIAQLGSSSLRMAPETWLDGRPVYRDSKVQMLDGSILAWDYITPQMYDYVKGWPAVNRGQEVTVFVDGVLAGTNHILADSILKSWDLNYEVKK